MTVSDGSNSSGGRVLACDLSAVEDVDGHRRIGESLFGRVEMIDELDDGYAYRLPGTDEVLEEAVAFVRNERLCCPFFTFEIVLEPDHGPVWLRLRGSEEIKGYIETMVNAWIEGDQRERAVIEQDLIGRSE